ncbi:hypothetical protein STEG23_005577, partial [Scotinomys teguina]
MRDAEATAGTTMPRMLRSECPERDRTGRHVEAQDLLRAEASALVELRSGVVRMSKVYADDGGSKQFSKIQFMLCCEKKPGEWQKPFILSLIQQCKSLRNIAVLLPGMMPPLQHGGVKNRAREKALD